MGIDRDRVAEEQAFEDRVRQQRVTGESSGGQTDPFGDQQQAAPQQQADPFGGIAG